jgi:hypothetical protein
VARAVVDIRDEAHPARVVLAARIVQALTLGSMQSAHHLTSGVARIIHEFA